MTKIQNELKSSMYAGANTGRTICGIRLSKGVCGLGQQNIFMMLLAGACIGNIVCSLQKMNATDDLISKGYDARYDNGGTKIRLGSNASRSGLFL